jgi:hypothetical protein
MAEAFRQSAPPHVFDREEMQRFEKQPVVLGFGIPPAGPPFQF